MSMASKILRPFKALLGMARRREHVPEPSPTYRADAKTNGDFIEISTYSSYGLSIRDPEAPSHKLPPDVDDLTLGLTVRKALKMSRSLSSEEMNAYGNLDTLKVNYENWVDGMMKHCDYKSRRALFKNMKRCGISLKDDIITIRPSNHERLEGWSGDGLSEEDRVKLPADCTDAELGAGLRLAFSRCLPRSQ